MEGVNAGCSSAVSVGDGLNKPSTARAPARTQISWILGTGSGDAFAWQGVRQRTRALPVCVRRVAPNTATSQVAFFTQLRSHGVG